MKTIIAGSRTCDNINILTEVLLKLHWDITEVVSGTARGADRLGEIWADINDIPVKKYKPAWDIYGKKAGFIRNCEMAEYADACLVLWDGMSSGSLDMIKRAVTMSENRSMKRALYLYKDKRLLVDDEVNEFVKEA